MSQQVPDNSAPVEDKALSVDDITKLFAEESTEEPEVLELEDGKKTATKKDKGDKQEAVAEDDEKTLEDEIEEELQEEEVDDDELEPVISLKRKEVLAKYPNLDKDFPALFKAYYREQAYAEILPTIEDAKTAVSKAELLDSYGEEILQNGSTESLLNTVKSEDSEAFARIIDNYLPTLAKVDQNAYYHVVGNVIKHTVMSLVQEGKESQNDDFTRAAEIIYEYVFGTKKFNPPTRLAKEDVTKPKEDNQISEREQEFAQRQLDSAISDISKRIDNTIESTVDKSIDPNQSMTDYVKRVATREVVQKLESTIEQDKRFMSIYDRLWMKASEDGYSQESMDRIKTAYLSKAKTLLPNLIRAARNEALKGLNKNTSNGDKDRKGPLPVGKTRSAASSSNSGKTDNGSNSKAIPKGMSTLDYLMAD